MDGCVDVAATAPVVVGKIFVKMKFQIMKNPIAISLYSIEYPSAWVCVLHCNMDAMHN